MLETVKALATSPLPVAQPCGEEHFLQCLKALDILPRRQDDAVGGKMKIAMYQRHLGGFSDDAMSYLASEATKTCHWFPSIAECLQILQAWPNRDRDSGRREKAKVICRNELQIRMDEILLRLERRELDQAAVDALPDRLKAVAAEKGFVFSLNDGTFPIRPDIELMTEEAQATQRAKVKAWVEEGLL